jgi:hypothetical protein
MSVEMLNGLAILWATDSPALPGAWAMGVWLGWAWGLVLALGVACLGRAWPVRRRAVAAAWVAVWCWVPGPYAPTYWLGLAFQAPSISTVVLVGVLLWAQFSTGVQARLSPSFAMPVAVLGVMLGWLLLLDTLAVLPLEWYALGFSPAAAGLTMAVLVLLARQPLAWLFPLGVLLFVATRLPSGNVWDALLDPLLWLALHGYVLMNVSSFYSTEKTND